MGVFMTSDMQIASLEQLGIVPSRKPEIPYYLQEANQIREDEGFKEQVYLDTKGYPTIGTGHLLKKGEFKKGDRPYSREQLEDIFQKDLKKHSQIVEKLTPNAPIEAKKILINMAFNLGESKLSKFKETLKAVNKGDYNKAADEMVNSDWYTQVGNRSKRLVDRMRRLSLNY